MNNLLKTIVNEMDVDPNILLTQSSKPTVRFN